MRSISRLLCSLLFLIFIQNTSKAQTTLVAGDIAFTGYIAADPVLPDQFSFVLLKAVTANTVIKFTDFGWRTDLNAFNSGINPESEITLTISGAQPAGTEITIAGASATLVGGASAGTMVYSTGGSFAAGNISFATSGDQIFAYQGTFASPAFISGLHMNVQVAGGGANNTDAATWDGVLAGAFLNGNTSGKPAALTTGTNALWFGTTGNLASEEDNAVFNCTPPLTPLASLLTSLYNTANWTTNDGPAAGFTLPTGCNYLGVLAAPGITGQPAPASICAGANTSFSITATGASSYQWQVDPGTGFVNITNNATYSGATTAALIITAAPVTFNTYQYRCVATNGVGSTNSNAATLTVTPLPVNPTLLAKTPATGTVADGTPVSATFNAGSGGTGCTDDYRYTTNGGASYLPYTPGSNISTTGLAAGSGTVSIEGRRANCSAGCQGTYVVLASWIVTPLPAGATTLNAGDIGFTGYAATSPGNDFSFVLLRNIGPGTAINFTDNGWLSTNVFGTGETTVTWTSNAAYSAGTEIKISGTTATLAAGGSAGTVTGTALSLSPAGDQILAYRGTAAAPTFISAIHMNVTATTSAAAWDGATVAATASALPTGLTTGVNCIWIGTPGDLASEYSNSRYGNCAGPGTLGPVATLRAAVNNQANWISDNNTPPDFTLPTGCPYLGVGTAPNITGQPANASICEAANTSFTITVTGATSYQWQVDPGTGFVNVTNNALYSGATTATLNITAAPFSINNTQYRCIATNGTGSTTSNGASLTLTPLAVAPTLAAKTPASGTVADGTPVSATFNNGSGGATCTDDFRYTTDGGVTYLPYTPGANISTTGVAAGSGFVFIEGRRAGCSGILACDAAYRVLASWRVTPDPAAPTTLNAGDIAFSGYFSTSTPDEFSFVLLKTVGAGTTINFTDNGWLSTNVFATGEQTVTWTAPAGGLPGGTEIKIAGLTATRTGGGAAGTVTGTALSMANSGDQILAYRGTAGAPTFISAIHMNVETTTTAASWDGVLTGTNMSALPTGLTTGVNAIWIGTPGNTASEHSNAKYGICNLPAVAGSLVALRAALNNQANWTVDDNTPPAITLPTGCNFLNVLLPAVNVTGTPLTAFTSCAGTASAEQSFTVSGSALTANIIITAPADFEISTTSGSGFGATVTLTQSGGSVPNTTIYVRMAASATGTPSGNITVASVGITTINVAVSGTVNPVPPTPTITAGGPTTFCTGGSVTLTSSSATGNLWSTGAITQAITVSTAGTYSVTVTSGGCTSATSAGTTVTVNPTPDAVATPSSQSICTGGTITTIALSGSIPGTQFDWTRDNTGTVTGIAASGSGDISGALTNTTNAPITVTFTITPTAGSCSGTAITATVVVNPIPNATATPLSQSRCSGAAIQAIVLGGNVSGTTFNWVRDNVGLIGGSIPASGSGNITGNLVNNTGAPVTVTFTITPTANGCPGASITATVTVNPLPLATINGGGSIVCQNSNFQLSATTDPGYTYAWGRSLFTNPFAPLGTSATQPIDVSGNYLLIVNNQYGCVDTAMTTVVVADYTFSGSLATGDAVQTGRLNRFANISTCAAPKACPLTFTTVGSRLYDSYTIVNPRNVPVCATIGITSYCGTSLFSAAYTGSYNPTNLCANYLADPGSSFTSSGFYEATIPANGTIVVVVHEVNPGTGCSGYLLSVNLPRDSFITVAPNDTICTGTPLMLTAPPANSYLWTPGGATTQVITPTPVLGTNTYSVQSVYGNRGCSSTLTKNVIVNATPTANAVPNQFFCANSTTTPITLSGPVIGTVYNWTNSNTAIGLAANGVGDIPAFTATNSTGAPISGTITVTPVVGSCTGSPITFTITIPNQPSITSVTADSVCAPGGVVNLAATGTGLIQWFDSLTNGRLLNTGPTFSPNVTTTTTYYVQSQVNTPAAQTLAMPAQSNTFPGNVRGYWFTAPVDFVITSLLVPTTASSGPQNIAVVKFNGNIQPPIFSATTNSFTTVFLSRQNTSLGKIPCNISIKAGEVIGILGSRGGINTYAPGDYVTSIFGQPVQLERLGMQFPLESTNPQNLWREFGPTTSISRVEFEYTNASCNSSPRVPVTATVLPLANATATPSSQTVCSGAITPIVLASSIAGTTYTWTRDNVATVTGIPASGTGLTISGTLTNTTTSPVTVTFTITPTTPDGCVGPDITATVTVQAIPTILCPANITVSNDAGLCGAVVTYSPTITGIPVPTVGYTFTGATTGSGSGNGSGATFNIGTTNVEIIATNICGADTCTFTVTVNDTENPTITCPGALTVSCAADVPAVNIGAVTASDNCPGVVVTHIGDVISGQTCANRFTVTRTYRATDASNNFVECTQVITVNDVTAPVMTCPAPVTISCAADVPPVNINDVTGVSDNCAGVVTVTHQGDVISGQTCANRFTITRTYRATDVCGNFTECTQIITVNDITPPQMTCPAPVTVSCAGSVPPVNINDVTGVSDNCAGVVTVTHQGDVIANQTCANRYQITRTYRATDVCGNFLECTQIITVDDQTPPTITCPAPVTVSCTADVPVADIASVTGVSDNCGGAVTITHEGDAISNQTCLNRYTITRTYRATDVCGNFTECTQIITVNDQTPPTMTCPAPITVSCAGDVPVPDIVSVTGVSDNCSGTVAVSHTGDVISNQTCTNRYTITRTYRATDACGNFTECTQIITVNDITPPTITCPAPITVNCAGDVPAADLTSLTGINDNCGGTVANGGLTVTHVGDVISNRTCANRYTVNRTYRVTDECGNFTECTQIITVNDITPPTITCPGPITVSCTDDVPAPNTALITGVSDNCAGPVAITHVGSVVVNQTCLNRYTIIRTYRATDQCGNFAECQQQIIVNDQVAPVITCPAPVTVSCAGQVPAPSVSVVTATDNCAGAVTITFRGEVISNQACANRYTVTRTYRATDVCGNFSECTQVITVNDQTPPTIACPANITATTPFGSCTAVVSYSPVVTDNCGGAVTVVMSPVSGSVFTIGVTPVTITATDACGNVSSCTFNVTVLDAQPPSISTQPATQTVCVGAGATFSVTAVNNVFGYQWQKKLGANWFDIAGATTASYSISIVTPSMDNDSFRVISKGQCSNVTSNAVALRVNLLPSITLSASPFSSLVPGQTTTITATATPAGGSFAWVFNGLPMNNGVTGPVLGPLTVDNIGAYRVVYTAPNGCVNRSTDIFIIGTPTDNLWVYPNPSSGRFQVRYFNTTNEPATLSIYNRLGQRVYLQKFVTGNTAYSRLDVDLRNQAAGVYVVEVTNGAGVKLGSKRIVLNH